MSLFAAWQLVSPALGKDAGLESLVAKSQSAMANQHWEQALDLNKRAVSRYGRENPAQRYGAQFGTLYFHKGICEMKLKRWPEAMRSFEICYRDFPNKGADQGNIYQKLALLKWAESAMAAESWKLAIQQFSKFTAERDRKRDFFPQGAFHISLAVCHYKLGQLPAGNENLEIALRNKAEFPTPDSAIVAGFQALVESAIRHQGEQALLDFIGKNRGELTIEPAEMQPFSSVFLKLAGDALARGMQRAAIAIYQFIPDTGDDSVARIKLTAMALIHEKNGHVRGAFAAYRQLERHFPQPSAREDDLYHLVRTAVLLDMQDPAKLYAGKLLAEFPESPRLVEVREAGNDFTTSASTTVQALGSAATVATDTPLPQTPEFTSAMDLYQGRKYRDAANAFSKIRQVQDSQDIYFAKFYAAECLRKIGDLGGLAEAMKLLTGRPCLGTKRLRQLEFNGLWEAVWTKNWTDLGTLANAWIDQELPPDQRAQVAYCQGLAWENLGRVSEALDAYSTAMTADAGASEEIVREAALQTLRILKGDPQVQAALARSPVVHREAPGADPLKEPSAVASLYELTLGAGMPLPEEFRSLLNAQRGK